VPELGCIWSGPSNTPAVLVSKNGRWACNSGCCQRLQSTLLHAGRPHQRLDASGGPPEVDQAPACR
jgi:hypothetical protein